MVLVAQSAVFTSQISHFHRAFYDHDQLINVERFFNEIEGALLDCCNRYFDIAMARNNHDRNIRVVCFYRFEDVDPIHGTVFKPDVENQHRGALVSYLAHRCVRRASQAGLIAFINQNV